MAREQTLEENIRYLEMCTRQLSHMMIKANAITKSERRPCLAHVEAETTIAISGNSTYFTMVMIHFPHFLNTLQASDTFFQATEPDVWDFSWKNAGNYQSPFSRYSRSDRRGIGLVRFPCIGKAYIFSDTLQVGRQGSNIFQSHSPRLTLLLICM